MAARGSPGAVRRRDDRPAWPLGAELRGCGVRHRGVSQALPAATGAALRADPADGPYAEVAQGRRRESGPHSGQAQCEQAITEVDSRLIAGTLVTHNPIDVKQAEQAPVSLNERPEALGRPECPPADTGYCSKKNDVHRGEAAGPTPLVARRRNGRQPSVFERLARAPHSRRVAIRCSESSSACRGFRHFLLCRHEAVNGEWSLGKHRLEPAPAPHDGAGDASARGTTPCASVLSARFTSSSGRQLGRRRRV